MRKLFLWEPSFTNANKSDFVDSVINYLLDKNLVGNSEKIKEAINYREKLNSTVIAYNLAVPHVQNKDIKQAILLFIKLKKGRFIGDWTKDNMKINRFIFTLIPEDCNLQDLQDLRDFYIYLSKDDVIQLFSQGEKDEVRNFLLRKGD